MPTRDFGPIEPSEGEPGAADESLDRLLHSADWPETPPLALVRLENHWRDVSPLTVARRRRRWLVAAAAILLAAAGVFAWWPTGDVPQSGRTARDDASAGPIVEDPPQRIDRVLPADVPKPVPDVSESPTQKIRQRRPRTQREWLAYRVELDAMTQQAVEQLATETDWTRGQIMTAAEPLRADPEYCLRQLVGLVATRTDESRRAAFDLLSELAGERSEAVLVQLMALPKCRDLALRALAPRWDSNTLATFVYRETDPQLRQHMLELLLQRQDVPSVGVYLDLVAALNTRQSALQTLRHAGSKPTAQLLGYLQRGNQQRRSAAILALAQLDDPRVVEQLARLALANVHRQAALMALMVRSDPQSAAFLRRAALAPAFASDLASARNQLAVVVMVNTTVSQEI